MIFTFPFSLIIGVFWSLRLAFHRECLLEPFPFLKCPFYTNFGESILLAGGSFYYVIMDWEKTVEW